MKFVKLISIVIILILLFGSLGFVFYQYKNNINAVRYYKQGLEFYREQKYQDAYYNFKQIKFLSNFYEVSLIKQYQCAIKLQDKKTAQAKLKLLSLILRDENIRPWAMYREAILSQEQNLDDKTLLEKFKKIYKMYPNSNFGYASAYKIAFLSKDENLKKEYLIQYLKYAPLGKFALNAIDELKKYQDLNPSQTEVIADALFAQEQYKNALDLYKQSEFEACWFKISKCYRALREFDLERNTIIRALNLQNNFVAPKEVDSALDRLCQLLGGSKLQNLKYYYSKLQNSPYSATLTYKLAETTDTNKIKYYEEVLEKYPDSIWASNSLWEIFWYNYKLGNYATCKSLAQSHSARYTESADAPRIAYWWAKILASENDSQSKEIYKKIIKEYPLNYYAFLSARQLKNPKAQNFITKEPIILRNIEPVSRSLFSDNKILKYLANSNDFETIDEFRIEDEYIKSWILYKKGNYPASIKIAQDKYMEENIINFQDKRLELIYPVLFEEEINKYCTDYSQSPYLFLSLIREESHFDKYAKSPVGAIGLAQIMLNTAEFIQKKPVTKSELIKNNIQIGVNYFDYLTKYFNENVYLAILAYNAGPGKIGKWMEDDLIKNNQVDIFVENIPYLETKNYMKKILSSYWAYVNIYSKGI